MFEFLCAGTEDFCDPAIRIAQLFVCAFLAILFLQSGLDKVFNWKGELGWITDHFAETPFKGIVPQMLAVITLFEVAAGATSAAGTVMLLVDGREDIALIGVILSGLSLLQLFAGQRIAKDYPGAAVLVPYFLVTLFALVLFAM